LKLAVAVSVEDFKDSIRAAFLQGLATALLVNVEDIVILSVTSKSTGRRLLAEGIDVATAVTVPEASSTTVITDMNLDNIAFAMADAGIETLKIEPPVVISTAAAERVLTAMEERLISNLRRCPCVA
jgi:hypothetical protein